MLFLTKILKTIWKAREVAYLVLILVLAKGWIGSSGPDVRPVDQPTPVIIVEPDLPEQVVAVARKADKPKGLVESVGTREVEPDRVSVSPPLVDGTSDSVSTDGSPRKVPSVPLEIPEWGIAEVDIDGRSLTVSALNHNTGAAERATYTLAKPHPKLTVRSGNVPIAVREGRGLGPIRLGIRATGFGGVDLNSGSPAIGGILEGPVGAKLGLGTLKPAVMVGFGEGVRVGGSYTIEIGDL